MKYWLALLACLFASSVEAQTSIQWGKTGTAPSNWQIGVIDNSQTFQPYFTQPPTGGGQKLLNALVPNPTTSVLGGIEALSSATSHEWLQYVDTSGVQHLLQPGIGDLSGLNSSYVTPLGNPLNGANGLLDYGALTVNNGVYGTNGSGVPGFLTVLPSAVLSSAYSWTNTTASTSFLTGAAVFAGGVGIGGALNIAGTQQGSGCYTNGFTSTGTGVDHGNVAICGSNGGANGTMIWSYNDSAGTVNPAVNMNCGLTSFNPAPGAAYGDCDFLLQNGTIGTVVNFSMNAALLAFLPSNDNQLSLGIAANAWANDFSHKFTATANTLDGYFFGANPFAVDNGTNLFINGEGGRGAMIFNASDNFYAGGTHTFFNAAETATYAIIGGTPGAATKYVCADASHNWFESSSAC